MDELLAENKKLLDITEKQLKTVLEGISDGIFVLNKHCELIFVNKAGAELFGYKNSNTCLNHYKNNKEFSRIIKIEDNDIKKCDLMNKVETVQFEKISVDQEEEKWFTKTMSAIFNSNENIELILVIIHDITDLIQKENRIKRELKTELMINECLNLIVKSRSETQIFDDICRIIVSRGDYLLTWIGLINQLDKRKLVLPVSQFGFEDGYLNTITITWDDSPSGQGPTGKAIKTRQTQKMQDIQNNPEFEPWREQAIKRGYQSSIAIPMLTESNQVIGTLNVYSHYPHAFNDHESNLLFNLAKLLTIGISKIQTENALEESLNIFRKL